MSWAKGDRLKITLEVTAEEPSDETADVWFPAGRSRDWINPTDIEEAGGTVTVEVISETEDALSDSAVPCSRPLALQLRAECSQSVEGCPATKQESLEANYQCLGAQQTKSCQHEKYEKQLLLERIAQLNVSGTPIDSPSVVVSVLVTPDSLKATVGVPADLSSTPSGESAGLTSPRGCSCERH